MTTFQQMTTQTTSIEKKQQRYFPLFSICICALELLYLLLVTLSSLPDLHLSNTPLQNTWPWTQVPAHLLLTVVSSISHTQASPAQLSTIMLGIIFLGLTGAYAGTLFGTFYKLRNDQNLQLSRRWLLLILGGALLFGLTLLFQPRLFSDDVFSYIFSGRILAIYGADPLNTAPIQFPADPFLPWVISGRNTPNISGPLWLCVASLLVQIGHGPVSTLLLFKGTMLLTHLVNCVLVWAILGRIAPARQLLCTLLYAWNPLALIELAGSAHNEGLLICLLLLATWFYVVAHTQGRNYWPAICSLVVLGWAISMNLITLLIAPLFFWFDIHAQRRASHAWLDIGWRVLSVLIMLFPPLIISIPFWRGASTFFAITSAIDMEHFVHAPVGMLVVPTHTLFLAIARWINLPPILHPIAAADMTLRASATFIFALIYVNLFSRVRLASTTMTSNHYRLKLGQETRYPQLDALWDSCVIAVLWYMVLVSGWFWPWYPLWMFWGIALRRIDTFTSAMLVLSGTALFIYPFVGFSPAPLATYQSALIFGIPLVYLVVTRSMQYWWRRPERIAKPL